MIKWFFEEQDRGTWEEAKFEILTTSRLLHKIEKYVLPYNDALVRGHRREYLEILTVLDERRKLLDFVYYMEYEDALLHIKELRQIAKAYVLLQSRLQDILVNLASRRKAHEDDDDTPFELVRRSDPLEPLEKPRARNSGAQEPKKLPSRSDKKSTRGTG
jgi:hypothetical protein